MLKEMSRIGCNTFLFYILFIWFLGKIMFLTLDGICVYICTASAGSKSWMYFMLRGESASENMDPVIRKGKRRCWSDGILEQGL